MRILNFVTSFWNNEEEARAKAEGEFGLIAWAKQTKALFLPSHSFVACGTWSDPSVSSLSMQVPVVNSGVDFTKPYDHFFWMYDGCAYTAAMAHALTRRYWDLIVSVDTDVLIGAVDFDALLREFMSRPELLLTPDWHGRPGGPFHCWKREGAARWLHQRRRANLIEQKEGDTLPLLIEDEMGDIFKGSWWNPWSDIPTMRYDYGQESQLQGDPLQVLAWPFCRLPHPDIIDKYRTLNTSRAKPVLAD